MPRPSPYAETIDAFTGDMCEALNKDAVTIEPDGDWIPNAVLEQTTGDRLLVVIDPMFFNDDDSKDRLTELLWSLIWGYGLDVVRVALSWGVWLAPNDDYLPVDHPERTEAMAMVVVDFEETRYLTAPVERTEGSHPTLGEWTSHDSYLVKGRFVDPIRKALTLKRDIAEDAVGALRKMRERTANNENLSPERREHALALLDQTIEVAESDPEGLAQMPTSLWWRGGLNV